MAYAAAGAAIENQCYLAGVNRVGTDPDASYAGDSALVDFRGATLADAGEREQTLGRRIRLRGAGGFQGGVPGVDGCRRLRTGILISEKFGIAPGMRYLCTIFAPERPHTKRGFRYV